MMVEKIVIMVAILVSIVVGIIKGLIPLISAMQVDDPVGKEIALRNMIIFFSFAITGSVLFKIFSLLG